MYPNNHQRPDPDVLLAQVQAQERRATRGKLRIYFGASAGVGKTYAMLTAARKLQAENQDLIIGIVETHGRSETLALLDGLEVLPLKTIEYRGHNLTEFDIDTALARRPALVLVDELAHSNAPNSRHPKRWQDVEELLSVGIDVFTTVNVQHLESLNDVVGGITGIRVSETLPDTVFDKADEVVLVDIPADELLSRLKAGKVYQSQQAERASTNFFRKGNLIALRELALRRTADRIEDDVQAYRVEKSINTVWKTDASLLACIGARSGDEHVIRSAARLANQLNTNWHVIYIETPHRLPAEQRERILKTLKLGEALGARTAILSGNQVAQEIINYARSHNFSKIILGRSQVSGFWRSSTLRQLATLAPDIDLIELGRTQSETTPPPSSSSTNFAATPQNFWHYLWAITASLLTAAVAMPLVPYLDLANIVMLFLLTVVLVAVRLGRAPAVISTVVGVAAFDFFFVSPRFSFAVSDVQYLVTFAVMLVVGLITAHLTAGLRYQARIASRRESRSRALYEFARELSGALQTEQIFEMTRTFVAQTFRVQATLLLPDPHERLQTPSRVSGENSEIVNTDLLDLGIAQWAFDHATAAGVGTDTLPGSPFFYLPLLAPMRTRGVLAIYLENRHWLLIPEQRQQLETFATLAAIALERVHYIEVAQDALLHMESERLRNSLLAALSHDLRTPLTALVGLSESLLRSKPPLNEIQHSLAADLHHESLRMSQLVSNLLDMARIQSGEVKLHLEWQSVEEIVGSALRASHSFLKAHEIQTRLAPDLPLIHIDAVLMERVLCNLLENATKYTPQGSRIVITAEVGTPFLEIAVNDNGPGLPVGKEEIIFEKFTRGERESATPGIGLGLAICRAIIEAHGGKIRARQALGGGASILFTLPLGNPPVIPPLDENA